MLFDHQLDGFSGSISCVPLPLVEALVSSLMSGGTRLLALVVGECGRPIICSLAGVRVRECSRPINLFSVMQALF